ncbi:hypothetical protein HCUR_00923 [Holospora curviuscula]|uniref:Uncharacterized protein n=1 Tax=Holospora curviuscula TaxID=1082868 RepID=A0A2S5R8H2_9PROT|nr:hypothetical protein HCUR_00923 [Holospora curviuscula]
MVGRKHLGVDTLSDSLNIDVYSARSHDRKYAKSVLFFLKKEFPKLVAIFILISKGFCLALYNMQNTLGLRFSKAIDFRAFICLVRSF